MTEQSARDAANLAEYRLKKVLDVISLAAIAVALGVVMWGEGPRVPGHVSIQMKIVLLDAFPFMFGGIWLIFRYAIAAREKFPLIFGGSRTSRTSVLLSRDLWRSRRPFALDR
jgi:hypothetical protein